MDLNLLWIETVYIGLYIGLYRKVSLKLSLYAWCVEQKSSLPLITIIRRDWYVKVEFLVFYQTGPVRRKRYKWEENTQKMLIELSKLSQYNQNTETQRKSNSGETIFFKKLSFLYTLVKEVKRRKSLSKKIIKHESLVLGTFPMNTRIKHSTKSLNKLTFRTWSCHYAQ